MNLFLAFVVGFIAGDLISQGRACSFAPPRRGTMVKAKNSHEAMDLAKDLWPGASGWSVTPHDCGDDECWEIWPTF